MAEQIMDPGMTHATPAAVAALERNAKDVWEFFRRHLAGDWGENGTYETTDVTEDERRRTVFATSDDGKLNKLAVDQADGSRVMSVYKLPDRTVLWVSTEGTGQHRNTVAMLPQDY